MSKTNASEPADPAVAPAQLTRAGDGMIVFEPSLPRVVFVNQQMLALLGVDIEQVAGKTWTQLAKQGLKLAGYPIFTLLSPDSLLEGELKTELHPSAPAIDTFVELDSYPVRDAAGQIREIVLIGRDISQRKHFEADLSRRIYERDVANEFSKALQRTVDLSEVLYVTLTGVTARQGLQFNRAFVLLYAPHSGTLEGEAAIGPLDSQEAGLVWRELSWKAWTLADLLSAYDSNHPPSDSRISARIRKLRLPVHESPSLLVRSMSGRRSFNVTRAVAGDGSIVEPSLIETLGTDTFAVIPLYTRHNPIGVMVVDNCFSGQPITRNQISLLEILAGHASSAIESSQLYKDLREKVRSLEISRSALKDNQQRLLRAERLSTVGKMAATVAHEIRNPLVSIGGFARLLKQQIPEDDPIHEDVEIMISEAMRLEKIVANILRYSHAQQAILQPTEIHSLINKTLDMLRLEIQERKIAIVTDFDQAIPQIEADQAQLMQVFYNLIINAIQAMDSGGTITVTTEKGEQAAVIRVKDTGCGISAENLDKIFKPFFTTRQSGAGLGLSVVADILDAHRGSISVSSQPGEGTEFLIRLPIG